MEKIVRFLEKLVFIHRNSSMKIIMIQRKIFKSHCFSLENIHKVFFVWGGES